MTADAKAKEIVTEVDQMRQRRLVHDTVWQEIADHMIPSREFTVKHAEGEKRTSKIYESSGPLAGEQLAAGLQGMLTSPALKWFGLRAEDQSVDNNSTAQVWLDATTDALYGMFNSASSKFNSSAHEFYLDLVFFGNGIMFVQRRPTGRGASFAAVPLNECYYEENENGLVDKLARETQQTARNIVRRFGEDKVSDKIKAAAVNQPNQMFTIIHMVKPRNEFKPGGGEYVDNMAFTSCYVEKDTMRVIGEGGFRSFPYMVGRFGKRSGEIYGTGPGWNALPDVKMSNEMMKVIIQAAQVSVYPPMQLPHDGFLAPLKLGPARLNYYRSGTPEKERAEPIMTEANPGIGLDIINAVRQTIRSAFYVDWMNLPEGGPNMTATEVLQRRDEKLRLLGPMLGRMETEFLGPLIERTFEIMAEQRMLPPPPDELRGKNLKIEYLSPIAQAQKTIEVEAMAQVFSAVAQLAEIDPAVAQIIKSDDSVRRIARIRGMPLNLLQDQRYMQGVRQQQAEQSQMAAAAEMAPGVAKAAKDGAEAKNMLQNVQPSGRA